MRALMALPKKIELVTFDVYGTLIDWEEGIYEALGLECAHGLRRHRLDVLVPEPLPLHGPPRLRQQA